MGEPQRTEHRTAKEPAPARLDLDVDLVPERGAQDSDASWGDPADRAADEGAVRRLLADKPPHHVG